MIVLPGVFTGSDRGGVTVWVTRDHAVVRTEELLISICEGRRDVSDFLIRNVSELPRRYISLACIQLISRASTLLQ